MSSTAAAHGDEIAGGRPGKGADEHIPMLIGGRWRDPVARQEVRGNPVRDVSELLQVLEEAW
jgi:hypothetical protein